jgi:1-acyl-sn-glycerol-3-phosphate acyltransferase
MAERTVSSSRELAAQNGSANGNASLLGSITSAAGRLAGATAGRLFQVPRADLDERDPDFIRENLPAFWLAASLYFRADVEGLENIPDEGPVLLVGNHSGGNVIPDTQILMLAFATYFGVERPFYQLAHNLILTLPGLGWLRKMGTVAASRENAHRALASGAALLVYPGGDYETNRPSWQSSKVDFGGRKGFIELALERNVPIVPVVAIGGQETALFLTRGERLAKLLMLDKLFRLKVLPISITFPWGLTVLDIPGHIPLPAKISIQVMEPINLKQEFGRNPDRDEVYDSITSRMQRTLDGMAEERTLPFFG